MRSVLFAILLAVAVPRPAEACLWDYDTLKEESLGQADVTAAVAGSLPKHSAAFYTAKVDYTKAILAKTPNKDRYDDLAVALAKLGKLDDALAVLVEKDGKFPNEYTTYANRGTFLAMKGDLAGALDNLKKAIAINADAHFGREKYQIQLLEYLQRLAKDPKLSTHENFLGIDNGADKAGESRVIFFLNTKSSKAPKRKLDPAIAAIVGLMRFGDGQDNMHLWYGLGWALVQQGDAQLAVRAFRRAEVLGHPRGRADGSIVSTTIKAYDGGCCPDPGDPRAEKVWTKLAPVIDKEFAAGQAADTKKQTAEDKLVAAKKLKEAFGY